MSKHKAIALAGLVLAFAILSPASALADPRCLESAPLDAEGTCRPLQFGGTGTVRLNTQTLQWTAEGPGIGTHTGIGPTHFSNGQARPIGFTPPNLVRLALEADVTIVAANGDKLYGHTTFTSEPFVLGSAHEDKGHGELDTTLDVSAGTFVQQDGVTWMISQAEFTSAGYVVY